MYLSYLCTFGGDLNHMFCISVWVLHVMLVRTIFWKDIMIINNLYKVCSDEVPLPTARNRFFTCFEYSTTCEDPGKIPVRSLLEVSVKPLRLYDKILGFLNLLGNFRAVGTIN
ncbi:hypothetical protein PPYR_12142 [Photinus pyralis]|uniref:Uncharacterized protein n=1 Tax=Photinus pyralis TaxID=7054 RepID=A0A5N4AD95_PHOPY|nr:hypothetical protein PPYR_12142 [Photinus pyralis]